jgi:hypothetical protein
MPSFLRRPTEVSAQEVVGVEHTLAVVGVAEVEEPGRHSIPQAAQFQRAVKSVSVARALMTSFLALRTSHECPTVSETLPADLKARHRDEAALAPVGAGHRQPAGAAVRRLGEVGHNNSMRPARWIPESTGIAAWPVVSRNHLLLVRSPHHCPLLRVGRDGGDRQSHWNFKRSPRFSAPSPSNLPMLNLSCTCVTVTLPTSVSLLPRFKPVPGSTKSSPFT